MTRPDGFRPELERHEYCYLTTRGRRTGQPHRIEIWFVVIDGHICVCAGGRHRADWVRNLMADPALHVEVGEHRWPAMGRPIDDAGDHPARARLAERYQGWRAGEPLSQWAIESLVVEISATVT